MPLVNAGSPNGSHTHRITGDGTWTELVTLIADSSVINVDQSYYTVQGKLQLECVLDPLHDSVVHCFNGGGFSVHGGGSVTFGAEISYNGKTSYWHGCTIIEDADAWARGGDNFTKFGTDNVRLRGVTSEINLYDSHWRAITSSRSDFDFIEGTLKIRQSQLYATGTNYMHFYADLDIDGFENWLDSSDGSPTELNASTVITQLNNYTPYKQGTGRQLVFSDSVPASPIVNYGGINFSRFAGGSGEDIYFDNPVSVSLVSVNVGAGDFVAHERRSLDVTVSIDGTGSQARVCVEDVEGASEINSLTSAGGVLSEYLVRQVWPSGNHTPNSKTPHVLRIHKYGYRSQEITLDVTPSTAGQGGFQLPTALVSDSTIVQTKAAALAHTGITITYELTPFSLGGKGFSIVVEGDLSVNPSLTVQDIRHYINAINEDGSQIGARQIHELITPSLETQTGSYFDGVKGVSVVDENGDPFPGIAQMQADDGSFYVAPVVYSITRTNIPDGAEVRVYDLDHADPANLGTELGGIETLVGTSFTYNYAGSKSGDDIVFQVIASGYKEYLEEINLASVSTTRSIASDLKIEEGL